MDHAHSDYFEGTSCQPAVLAQAMSALLADLQAKGLKDWTLVVLGTEFDRRPRINGSDGRNGSNTHSDNFERTPRQAAVLDQAMSAVLADLQTKGLPAQTQVVLATEFGHTPRINDNDGRDHHDTVFTCLLAGAGIKRGTPTATTSRGPPGKPRPSTRL